MMAAMGDDFLDVRTHGFARVAVAVPEVRVADPAFNAEAHLRLLEQVHREGAHYALCPELGLSGYSCADLFFQETLLAASLAALGRVAAATAEWNLIVSVGMPLVVDDLLFNCAVTLFRGRPVALAPKAFPPNYREFYERRWFHPAADARAREITLLGERVPFGTDVLVAAPHLPGFVLHTDICEDLWTPGPPGTLAALRGGRGAPQRGRLPRVPPHHRAAPLRARRSRQARRPLPRDLPHQGDLARAAAARAAGGRAAGGDRHLGRAGFDRGPPGRGARHGSPRAAPHAHLRRHHARLRDLARDLRERVRAGARARRHAARDRHHADRRAGVRGDRAQSRAGGPHLRERAGVDADIPPLRAHLARARHHPRHRRPLRAGARLGDLRRRPHVALRHQRGRAEDARLRADPLGGRGDLQGRARGGAGAARRPRHADQPRAAPPRPRRRDRAALGGADRPLRAARLLPLLLPALRLRPAAHRAHGAARLRRALRGGGDPALAPRLPRAFLRQPVQARLRPRRPQSRLGRLPLPPRRLAHALRRLRGCLAQRSQGDPREPRPAASGAARHARGDRPPLALIAYARRGGVRGRGRRRRDLRRPARACGSSGGRVDRRSRAWPRTRERRRRPRPRTPPRRATHPPRNTISPCVGSYGDTAIVTRSPGMTRMW